MFSLLLLSHSRVSSRIVRPESSSLSSPALSQLRPEFRASSLFTCQVAPKFAFKLEISLPLRRRQRRQWRERSEPDSSCRPADSNTSLEFPPSSLRARERFSRALNSRRPRPRRQSHSSSSLRAPFRRRSSRLPGESRRPRENHSCRRRRAGRGKKDTRDCYTIRSESANDFIPSVHRARRLPRKQGSAKDLCRYLAQRSSPFKKRAQRSRRRRWRLVFSRTSSFLGNMSSQQTPDSRTDREKESEGKSWAGRELALELDL